MSYGGPEDRTHELSWCTSETAAGRGLLIESHIGADTCLIRGSACRVHYGGLQALKLFSILSTSMSKVAYPMAPTYRTRG